MMICEIFGADGAEKGGLEEDSAHCLRANQRRLPVFKRADANNAAAINNLTAPKSVFLYLPDVGDFPVPRIFQRGDVAEVIEPVIILNPVDVVYDFRVISCHHFPYNAMSEIIAAKYSYDRIPVILFKPVGPFSRMKGIELAYVGPLLTGATREHVCTTAIPNENARLPVIRQEAGKEPSVRQGLGGHIHLKLTFEIGGTEGVFPLRAFFGATRRNWNELRIKGEAMASNLDRAWENPAGIRDPVLVGQTGGSVCDGAPVPFGDVVARVMHRLPLPRHDTSKLKIAVVADLPAADLAGGGVVLAVELLPKALQFGEGAHAASCCWVAASSTSASLAAGIFPRSHQPCTVV